MRFLNPKTDFAFKKIFGSEESRDILLSFLNAILELEHPYFLKNAPDLSAVPPVLAQEPAIAHAFGIANKASLTPEELEDQERREIFIQDQRGALALVEQRGERSKALAIARNLLDVLDDATIAATTATGLSMAEIARFRTER